MRTGSRPFRRLRRVRRPLLALLVLMIALAVGYGVRAARSDSSPIPVHTVVHQDVGR